LDKKLDLIGPLVVCFTAWDTSGAT
jgi:hypothetical protein